MARPISTITRQKRLDTLADDLLTLLESRSTVGKWRTDWMTTIIIEHPDPLHDCKPSFLQVMTPLAIRRCEFFAEQARRDDWDGHIVMSGKPSVLRCMIEYIYTGRMEVERHIHFVDNSAHDSPAKIEQLMFLSELWVACVKFGVKTGPEAVYTDFKDIIDAIKALGGFAQLAPVISKLYTDDTNTNQLLRGILVEACPRSLATQLSPITLDALFNVPAFRKDLQAYAVTCSTQLSVAGTLDSGE